MSRSGAAARAVSGLRCFVVLAAGLLVRSGFPGFSLRALVGSGFLAGLRRLAAAFSALFAGVGLRVRGGRHRIGLGRLLLQGGHKLLPGQGHPPLVDLRQNGVQQGVKLPQALGVHALLPVEGPQGEAELLFAVLILPDPVLILLQAVLVLLLSLLVLLDALLVVPEALGVVGIVGVVLLPAVVQLLPGVLQLDLSVVQLLPGVLELPLPVGDLRLPLGHLVVELLKALVVLVQAVVVLPPAVVQLPSGVLKLLLRVGQLLLRLGPGLVQLRLGVGQLPVGLIQNLLPAEGGPHVPQLLQLAGVALHAVLIGVAVGLQLRRPLHHQIGVGVGVHGEGRLRQQQIGRHLARAQGGAAPLHPDVQRRVRGAHDGEGVPRQGVLVVPLAGVQGDPVPQLQPRLGHQPGLCQALVRRLGQPALLQGGEVHIFRQGQRLYNIIIVLPGQNGVDGIGPPGGQHPRLMRQGRNVLLRQSQGGHDAQVHQLLVVKVPVRRQLHVRRRGPQARQKAHRQRGEDHQGEEAAPGADNLPHRVGEQPAGRPLSGSSHLKAPPLRKNSVRFVFISCFIPKCIDLCPGFPPPGAQARPGRTPYPPSRNGRHRPLWKEPRPNKAGGRRGRPCRGKRQYAGRAGPGPAPTVLIGSEIIDAEGDPRQGGRRPSAPKRYPQTAAETKPGFPQRSLPGLRSGKRAGGGGPFLPGYHSICSTGTGRSFRSIRSTRPFFTWITWSAMGAMALLWVMTTTVIPSWRQVS